MKCFVVLFLLCVVMSVANAQDVTPVEPADELQQTITVLIEKLDSTRFAERRSSEQRLLRMGQAAVEPMRKAIERADGEAKLRLQRILTELSRSIRIVDKVTSKLLQSVTSVSIDPNGQYLYASAFAVNTVSAYAIDPEDGKLTEIETITDDEDLKGAVSIRLSETAPLAVAACFSGKTIVLFSRSRITGKLTKIDVYRGDAKSPMPNFPIEAVFSPNGKFVYCADPYAQSGKNHGAVLIFRVTEDRKLKWVETFSGQDSCLANVRGILFHPTKNEMYLCGADAGALTRASYDPDSGAITLKQVLRDGEKNILGLSGVFAADISTDGKFVYTSSGRFGGDSAVGVFTFDDTGDLQVVQEMISGREKMGEFLGGNELVISPDGKNVYVTGTRSSTLAGFARDSDTGKLTFIETVPFGAKKLGPAGIAISPYGDYVYAAVEGESAIAIFRRDQ
ncbi:MAG: beta-propeller fold lactonase family protein [Pirellulaceae bacterium]|nr:beta-propeller fold lactonase family protein [Pirellulaceae bacterium]